MIFLYVDNIQIFSNAELKTVVSDVVVSAAAFIGTTIKDDGGFCSYKNPMAPLSEIVTRDNTASQKEHWSATKTSVMTGTSQAILDRAISSKELFRHDHLRNTLFEGEL